MNEKSEKFIEAILKLLYELEEELDYSNKEVGECINTLQKIL